MAEHSGFLGVLGKAKFMIDHFGVIPVLKRPRLAALVKLMISYVAYMFSPDLVHYHRDFAGRLMES